jgi:hypothetical protein
LEEAGRKAQEKARFHPLVKPQSAKSIAHSEKNQKNFNAITLSALRYAVF